MRKPMLNISFCASSEWSAAQKNAAKVMADTVIDLSMPEVDAELTTDEVIRLAVQTANAALDAAYASEKDADYNDPDYISPEVVAVVDGGPAIFVAALVRELQARCIPVYEAATRGGQFVNYREYPWLTNPWLED